MRGERRLRRAAWEVNEEKRLASPSHLFLPLRQLVQARAPRFGMCADGTEEGGAWAGESWGDAISDRLPLRAGDVLKLVVRRRLPLGWSS